MTASANIKTPLMTLPLRTFLQDTDLPAFLDKHGLSKHRKVLAKAGIDLPALHKASLDGWKGWHQAKIAEKLLVEAHKLADKDAVIHEFGLSTGQGADSISKQISQSLQVSSAQLLLVLKSRCDLCGEDQTPSFH